MGRDVLSSLTDEDKRAIRSDRERGVSLNAIGRRYGVSGVAVRYWFDKLGWSTATPLKPLPVPHEHLGYLWVSVPGRGTVSLHRLEMEKHLGRRLERHEIVHHIDGNKQNNDIANLELIHSISAHMKEHAPKASGKCANCDAPAQVVSAKQGASRCKRCWTHIREYHGHDATANCNGRRRCPLKYNRTDAVRLAREVGVPEAARRTGAAMTSLYRWLGSA